MADEVARMMADLGIARREFVSTPMTDGRGQEIRADANAPEQEAIAAQAKSRRAQVANAAPTAHTDAARASRIQAWNTETTFEPDSITDQLEDRWSGQGHRAQLSRRSEYDSQWENIQNRFGEERAMYLQNRNSSGNSNYVASPRPPSHGQNGFAQHVLSRRDATPRSFANRSSGSNGGSMNRGRRPIPVPVNPKRAPSPRSFGTVRIKADGQRVENGVPSAITASRLVNRAAPTTVPPTSSLPDVVNSSPARATSAKSTTSTNTTIRPLATSPRANGVIAPQSSTTPPGAPIARQTASAAVTATASSGSSRTSRAMAGRQSSGPPLAIVYPTFTWESSVSNAFFTSLARVAVVQNGDDSSTIVIKSEALVFAAQPGASTDAKYTEFPTRQKNLFAARKYLIAAVTRLAFGLKPDDDPQVISFLKRGPNRAWMLEAARQAMSHARYNTNAAEEYYAAKPEHLEFLHAAKAVVEEEGEAHAISESQAGVRSTAPNSIAVSPTTSSTATRSPTPPSTINGVPTQTERAAFPGAFPQDNPVQATHHTTNGASPAVNGVGPTTNGTVPSTDGTTSPAATTSPTTPSAVNGVPTQTERAAFPGAFPQDNPVQAAHHTTNGASPAVNGVGPTTNGTTPSTNGTTSPAASGIRVTRTLEQTHSAANGATPSPGFNVSTQINGPRQASKGMLIATVTDFLTDSVENVFRFALDVPMKLKIDLTSGDPAYDARKLIPNIERFAESLKAKSIELEGVKETEDGLYEETS